MVNLAGGDSLLLEESAPPVQVTRLIRRHPPRWFVRKLKATYSKLDCRWNEKEQKWEIGEWCNWMKVRATDGPKTFYHLFPRWQRVIYAEELGTRVLDFVRRVRIGRFVTTGDMVEGLNIDYMEDSKE